MDLQDYLKALNHLLQINVENISEDDKTRLLQKHIELYHSRKDVLSHNLTIVPFIPGRRSFDEAYYPGLGSSEEVALFTDKTSSEINFLYRIFQNQKPVNSFPDHAVLTATITTLDHQGKASFLVPTWIDREIEPQRKGDEALTGTISETYSRRINENLSESWTLSVPAN